MLGRRLVEGRVVQDLEFSLDHPYHLNHVWSDYFEVLAFMGGEAVGYGLMRQSKDLFVIRNPFEGYRGGGLVHPIKTALYVREEYRRSGVGTAILTSLIEVASALTENARIEVVNVSSAPWVYEKAGFRVVPPMKGMLYPCRAYYP